MATSASHHPFLLVTLLVFTLCRVITGTWMESVVDISFEGSLDHAFVLYQQLDEHPTWSPWLKKVEYDRDSGKSSWTLSSLGLTLSWDATNVETYEPYVVQWKSLTGLPNKGRVEFSSNRVVCKTIESQNIDKEKEFSAEVEVDTKGDIATADPTRTNAGRRFCGPMRDLVLNEGADGEVVFESADGPAATSSSTDTTAALYEQEPETVFMKVIASYDMPDVAAAILKALGPIGRSFIYNTIHGDLKRFKTRVQKELKEIAATSTSSAAASDA